MQNTGSTSIDPTMLDGLKTATELILKICGGEQVNLIFLKKVFKSKNIDLNVVKFKNTIGFSIADGETKILNSLGFKTQSGQKF